jgi:hypothetical protein
MITTATEFWMETDANRDGVYELLLPRRPITLPLAGTLVGMNAFQTSEADNFEFFDAVLTPQPGAVSQVGQPYVLDLATPAPNAAWLGLVGLGNTGFAIGSRAIPVDADGIAILTFGNAALGLTGVTDANGDAVVNFQIPPLPFLAGFRMFIGAMTLDGNQPFAIGHISNEQAFVITP